MYLKRVIISNFKNIGEVEVLFSPKINFITGVNGSGKTNLLDAVYYLSMTKSYFSNSDIYSVKHGESFFSVTGEYEGCGSAKEVESLDTIESNSESDRCDRVTVNMAIEGDKVVKKNLKSYARLSDHIGSIPIVMISPYDTALINDSGEERRRFINSILSQIDKEYLRKIQGYNNLLAQRNRLLKSPDAARNGDLLDLFAERLSVNAAYIHKERRLFSEELLPFVSKYYGMVSGAKEEIGIKYRSDIEHGELSDLLKISRERDLALRYTSAGIHRDDLLFTMGSYPIKSYGSQGQQKSFLVSLKLAQFEIMKGLSGKKPILLLDDVFDKLDINRVESLLDMVSSDSFGQIFITDSNKIRAEKILGKIGGDSSVYEMALGRMV